MEFIEFSQLWYVFLGRIQCFYVVFIFLLQRGKDVFKGFFEGKNNVDKELEYSDVVII